MCLGIPPHFIYVCPQNGETECVAHGGFDVCCADPSCPSKFEIAQYVRRKRVPYLPDYLPDFLND